MQWQICQTFNWEVSDCFRKCIKFQATLESTKTFRSQNVWRVFECFVRLTSEGGAEAFYGTRQNPTCSTLEPALWKALRTGCLLPTAQRLLLASVARAEFCVLCQSGHFWRQKWVCCSGLAARLYGGRLYSATQLMGNFLPCHRYTLGMHPL